jgi:signal transduction histidine kinase
MASYDVYRTGRSARSGTHLSTVEGPIGDTHRRMGIMSAVASPIVVEGRFWGAMAVHGRLPLPPDTEERLEKFTELVATAIANAETRSQLSASRARIVAASDEARRRIERDLHDGAQQRLVSIALGLRAAEASAPAELRAPFLEAAEGLTGVLDELREISRGLHPAVLEEGGLELALKALARRSVVPVSLDVRIARRLPEQLEMAAYFIVSEALTNAAKHSEASRVHIEVDDAESVLHLAIRDDGVGGADPARGSGLLGLRDRVEVLDGTLSLVSPAGDGTSMLIDVPIRAPAPEAPRL